MDFIGAFLFQLSYAGLNALIEVWFRTLSGSIENVQEGFLPIFYHGKGDQWRRQFTRVSGPNFFHGPSGNMILGRIPLIENFSMTLHELLLG